MRSAEPPTPLQRAIQRFNSSHIMVFNASTRMVIVSDWRKYIATNGKARIQKGWLTYDDLTQLVRADGGIAHDEPLFVVRVIGGEVS